MENPPVLFLTIYHRPSTMWHVTNTPAIDVNENRSVGMMK